MFAQIAVGSGAMGVWCNDGSGAGASGGSGAASGNVTWENVEVPLSSEDQQLFDGLREIYNKIIEEQRWFMSTFPQVYETAESKKKRAINSGLSVKTGKMQARKLKKQSLSTIGEGDEDDDDGKGDDMDIDGEEDKANKK